jgi:hypothetical protein
VSALADGGYHVVWHGLGSVGDDTAP